MPSPPVSLSTVSFRWLLIAIATYCAESTAIDRELPMPLAVPLVYLLGTIPAVWVGYHRWTQDQPINV